MENTDKPSNIFDNIDLNNPDFYNNVQDETEFDKARMKKSIQIIIRNLRIKAAEIEVETTWLCHAELWHTIEELKTMTESMLPEKTK